MKAVIKQSPAQSTSLLASLSDKPPEHTPQSSSYRSEAQNFFGGEEKFADALVLYFGGSYNHYRESGELTSNESNYIENYLDACTNQ